jgi:hypothetical protein
MTFRCSGSVVQHASTVFGGARGCIQMFSLKEEQKRKRNKGPYDCRQASGSSTVRMDEKCDMTTCPPCLALDGAIVVSAGSMLIFVGSLISDFRFHMANKASEDRHQAGHCT